MQNIQQFQEELKQLLMILNRLGQRKQNALLVFNLQTYITHQFETIFQVSINFSPENPLSFMEGLCLALLLRGYPNKKIATLLNIHLGTVYTHLNRVRKKLKTSSLRGASYQALACGYLSLKNKFS